MEVVGDVDMVVMIVVIVDYCVVVFKSEKEVKMLGDVIIYFMFNFDILVGFGVE